MKIVSVAIQKGGAGKTTTTVNLAAALRDAGKKCLLVDLDPQASLTQSLGIRDEPDPSIYHLLKKEASGTPTVPEEAIQHRAGMDVLPASLDLAGAEVELVSVYGREHVLSQVLQRLKESYDFVLIDCPPSIGMLTVNALVASDHVLMPVLAEFLSLQGAASFQRHLQMIRRLNEKLHLLGFVLTQYDGRKLMTGEIEAALQQEHGPDKVFQTHIRSCIALAKAQQAGVDIFFSEKSSNGAADYEALGREFLGKLEEAS